MDVTASFFRGCRVFLGGGLIAGLLACGEGGTVASRGVLSLPESSVDFCEVPVFSQRMAQIQVCNAGRGTLSLWNFQFVPLQETGATTSSSNAPSDDSLVADLTVESVVDALGSGECGEVVIGYRPRHSGLMGADLVFATDDGHATEGRIHLSGTSTTQATLAVPASLDVGTVCEGASEIFLARVSSTGNADLEITSAALVNASGDWVSLMGSSKMPLVVPPGKSAALALAIAPPFGTVGPLEATLALATNDPDGLDVQIPVRVDVRPAPVAHIAALVPIAPGVIVSLDGRASSSPAADGPLSFDWSLDAAPPLSTSAIEDSDASVATFAVDRAGTYAFSLAVSDEFGCISQRASVSAEALTAEGLRFELFWDSLDADLDLHLVPKGHSFFSEEDCHFSEGTTSPDWGVLNDSSDDPVLSRDALVGYGPEVISFPSPASGTYRAMVHYFADHHSLFPATRATLRTYKFGVLISEESQTLANVDATWEVLDVTWPGGAISPVSTEASGATSEEMGKGKP